jgi:glycosyltransferase involved in cell wall biosynthesis
MAGVPVVATDVGSNSEIIEDGITGILTKKDALALAAALQIMVSEERLLVSMGSEATRESIETFRLKDMHGKHFSLYLKLQN